MIIYFVNETVIAIWQEKTHPFWMRPLGSELNLQTKLRESTSTNFRNGLVHAGKYLGTFFKQQEPSEARHHASQMKINMHVSMFARIEMLSVATIGVEEVRPEAFVQHVHKEVGMTATNLLHIRITA